MNRLVSILVRKGIRKGWSDGVVGGNRAWVVVGGVALVSHLAGRAMSRDVDVVFSEPIAPGESWRITHLPKP